MFSYTYILIYRLTVFCRFLKNYTNSINCTYNCTACFIIPLFLRYYYWKRYSSWLLTTDCKIFHLIIMPHFICIQDIYLVFRFSLLWQCCNEHPFTGLLYTGMGRISREYNWLWNCGVVGHLHFPLYCYVWIALPLGLQINLHIWGQFPTASSVLMFLLIRWVWNGISFLF